MFTFNVMCKCNDVLHYNFRTWGSGQDKQSRHTHRPTASCRLSRLVDAPPVNAPIITGQFFLIVSILRSLLANPLVWFCWIEHNTTMLLSHIPGQLFSKYILILRNICPLTFLPAAPNVYYVRNVHRRTVMLWQRRLICIGILPLSWKKWSVFAFYAYSLFWLILRTFCFLERGGSELAPLRELHTPYYIQICRSVWVERDSGLWKPRQK